MNEKPPSYEQAVLESKKYVKPVLVQPNAGRYVHKIPEEIQPGIPSRQFIIMEKCPACGVSYFYLVSEALKFRRFPVNRPFHSGPGRSIIVRKRRKIKISKL